MNNYAVRDYYGGFSIMKITKILGAASAAVVSAAVMAASAGAYEAFLMYASSDWSVQCMDATSENATTADVTGDGTYTVAISGFEWEDEETAEMVPATATGATVFCVDIDGLANALGCGKDAEGYDALQTAAEKMAFAQATGLTISDVVITATNSDGTSTDIAVDESKLYYGDIEGNGKIRLEIYNAYGDTSKDAPIDAAGFSFDDTLSVTFTISGTGMGDAAASDDNAADAATVDAEAPADNAAASDGKGSPDTGVEGIAVVAGVAALAAGAVIVSKKRRTNLSALCLIQKLNIERHRFGGAVFAYEGLFT